MWVGARFCNLGRVTYRDSNLGGEDGVQHITLYRMFVSVHIVLSCQQGWPNNTPGALEQAAFPGTDFAPQKKGCALPACNDLGRSMCSTKPNSLRRCCSCLQFLVIPLCIRRVLNARLLHRTSSKTSQQQHH